MDVPLFWKSLTRVTDLRDLWFGSTAPGRWSGCGWRWVLPALPAPPSTSQWIPGITSCRSCD
eukprot:1150708-Pelagomonas_calceolata.AAC.1